MMDPEPTSRKKIAKILYRETNQKKINQPT